MTELAGDNRFLYISGNLYIEEPVLYFEKSSHRGGLPDVRITKKEKPK